MVIIQFLLTAWERCCRHIAPFHINLKLVAPFGTHQQDKFLDDEAHLSQPYLKQGDESMSILLKKRLWTTERN